MTIPPELATKWQAAGPTAEQTTALLARLAWLLISGAGGQVRLRAADVLSDPHRRGVMTIETTDTGLEFTLDTEAKDV